MSRHPLPAEVYALVEQSPAAVLLEGGNLTSGDLGRTSPGDHPWTQLFLSPSRICVAHTAAEIPALFAEIENAIATGQFAAGFFTYECAGAFEPKAHHPNSRPGHPLAWFAIYARSYVFDHDTGEFIDGEPKELERFRAEIESASPQIESSIAADFSITESDYAQRIARIHEWIRAGDVYQLNFTAPFRVSVIGRVAAVYAQLRERQPAAYGAFIHWSEGRHILSFSPELFFRVDHDGDSRHIVTRPMKGTSPRGRTTKEDREIAEWLQNDPKNRSENLMIVDLLRSDLGRIARFGSVTTRNLFAVEHHPTLWQMTSTVEAELRSDVRLHDIFRALFPCGSVTGAPKVRAMQSLAELEREPRGIYTGAIGFFSPHQTVFNVAIRTLDLADGKGIFGAGSGIVIDSKPDAEFRECLLKAKFLTGRAHRTGEPLIASQPDKLCLIETMLWNGSYPLLDLHLDRLVDSALYFDFACDRAAVRAALEQHARQFADSSPRKVRLLLVDTEGNVKIASDLLPSNTEPARIGRVCISPHRTDPADAMLYHKTTQRPLYTQAAQQAACDGLDDFIFLNKNGEVTEGAISNIFVEKDCRWFTPPIECGLLPGVYRRHLLAMRSEPSHPEIAERVLHLDDLRGADAIYICNAVRGLRRVELVET